MSSLLKERVRDIIIEFLVSEGISWRKLVFFAGYGVNDIYDMEIYLETGKGFEGCSEDRLVNINKLLKTFSRINELLVINRKVLGWNTVTIVTGSNNKTKVDRDYTNEFKDPITYKMEWKKYYLKSEGS